MYGHTLEHGTSLEHTLDHSFFSLFIYTFIGILTCSFFFFLKAEPTQHAGILVP